MGNKYKKWINFPNKYDLVVGDTFELFYRGVLRCGDPSRYNIKITCAKGAYFTGKYMFTPTENDIGEYPLTMEVSDDCGDVLDTDTVRLIVRPAAVSPDKDTYVLCVGDSITAGGQWVSECCRRLTASDGEPKGLGLKNLHFVGGRKGQYGAYFEGYGGWKFDDYNTAHMNQGYIKYITADHNKTEADRHSIYTSGDSLWSLEEIENGKIKLNYIRYVKPLPDCGVLKHVSGGENHDDIVYTDAVTGPGNPFWDTENECVDFKKYADKHGIPRYDILVVMLGWNSWWHTEARIREQIHIFFKNFRAQYPDCRIVLVGPHLHSQDGLGVCLGCLWNYAEFVDFAFNLDSWYRDIAAQYDNMYYINMAGQFDSDHNYPTAERKVNARSSQTEVIQVNDLHPTDDGYKQIGDIMYRALNYVISDMRGGKTDEQ